MKHYEDALYFLVYMQLFICICIVQYLSFLWPQHILCLHFSVLTISNAWQF